MARRARRTPMEKCQEELAQVQDSIRHYEESLKTLQEREKALQDQILMEKFKEVNELLEVQNMSLDDLKGLLAAENDGVQIA